MPAPHTNRRTCCFDQQKLHLKTGATGCCVNIRTYKGLSVHVHCRFTGAIKTLLHVFTRCIFKWTSYHIGHVTTLSFTECGSVRADNRRHISREPQPMRACTREGGRCVVTAVLVVCTLLSSKNDLHHSAHRDKFEIWCGERHCTSSIPSTWSGRSARISCERLRAGGGYDRWSSVVFPARGDKK